MAKKKLLNLRIPRRKMNILDNKRHAWEEASARIPVLYSVITVPTELS